MAIDSVHMFELDKYGNIDTKSALIKNQQLSFSDDFWTDPKLRRKLEKVDILQTRLYKHNALTPDDYKDMLKDADALYNTACEIVDYIQEGSYPE